MQAGTGSWYFTIDNFAIYTINTPVISTQPLSQTVDAGTPATFIVVASGNPPLSYQWKFFGTNLPNATNASLTIPNVQQANVGQYQVIVSNNDGPTKSSPANLNINTLPQIFSQPIGEIADVGASVSFAPTTGGGRPLTHFWSFNGSRISTSLNSSLTLASLQITNAGFYQLIASNSYGSVTSSVVTLKVWSGPLTSNLVVHLPFDGNFNDTSGRGNNAAYATNGAAANPSPTFVPGKIGQAFEYTTTQDATSQEYATLGYPADLQLDDSIDFSVSLWANYTNQTDDLPFISNKDWDSSGNPGWGIFTQGGGNFRMNVTGPNGNADKFSTSSTPPALKDGSWHHIVVSFLRAPFLQSAFVYAYLDGQLVNKTSMSVAGTIDTLSLPFSNHQNLTTHQTTWAVNIGQDGTGVYHDNGSAYDINAMIDDVGIWRRALTANEAKGIYIAGQSGKDLSQAAPASSLIVTIVGANVHVNWNGSPTLKLQKATSLNPPNWVDVPATLGASSASVSFTGSAAFFRLSQ
jgi:hypothetical protein